MVRDSLPHTCSRTADCSQNLRGNPSRPEVGPLTHQSMASHHNDTHLDSPHSGEPTREQPNPRVQQQKYKPSAILRGQLKLKGTSAARPLPSAVPVSTPGAGPSTERLQHTRSGSSRTSRAEGSAFPKPFDHIVHDGYPPTVEVAIPHQLFSSNDDENTTRIIRPRRNDKGKARDD
jgi:hypothetical protein